MNVLARVDDYVHNVRAGSEVTLHLLLLDLARRGHDVQVIGDWAGRPVNTQQEHNGLPVLLNPSTTELETAYEWADVVVTQQAVTRRCIEETSGRAPVVFVCHIRGQEQQYLKPGDVALVVFNSAWMALESTHVGPTMVVHPPVWLRDYETSEEGRTGGVLQVNLSANKGGGLFWWLARSLPDRKFLAAEGTWGEQRAPHPLPPNVTWLPKTDDPRQHYSRATVVLMPSLRETYGRVALEAACSGIPAVVHPTAGLREALGDAALYADRDRPQAWLDALDTLSDPGSYQEWSARALARAEWAQARSLLEADAFEAALLQVASPRRARVWAFASEPHYLDHVRPYLSCVDPRIRGHLCVPQRGPESVATTIRAWKVGYPVMRLPSVRGRAHRDDLLASMGGMDLAGSACVVVSETDRMVAREWFSVNRLVRGEHGAGQTYDGLDHHSFAGGPGHAGLLAATAPNQKTADLMRSKIGLSAVAPVGCPRLYAMQSALRVVGRTQERLLVVSFRYPGTEAHCQELSSAWAHYRDSLKAPDGWRMAVHLHPRARGGEVEAYARERGWEVIEEFFRVVHRATVFAVDNSSSAVEWHHLRGGSLVLLNCPTYRRWISHGLRFWDMLAWPGVVPCEGPDELSKAVEESREQSSPTPCWFDEADPKRLERWLSSMLRPERDLVRVCANTTFEGAHGRVVRGRTAWVPREYGEQVARKGMARILSPLSLPALGSRGSETPSVEVDGGQTYHEWAEVNAWRS